MANSIDLPVPLGELTTDELVQRLPMDVVIMQYRGIWEVMNCFRKSMNVSFREAVRLFLTTSA